MRPDPAHHHPLPRASRRPDATPRERAAQDVRGPSLTLRQPAPGRAATHGDRNRRTQDAGQGVREDAGQAAGPGKPHPPFELRAQLATERWTRREAHTDVCCRATAVGTLAVMMLNFVVWLGMAIAAEKNALFSGGVEDPVNQAAIALGAEGGVVVVGTLLGCMMGRCMRAVGEAQAQRAHAVVRSIGELQAQAASQVGELRTRATLLVQREFDPPPASATRQARDHVVVIRAGAEQDADAQH